MSSQKKKVCVLCSKELGDRDQCQDRDCQLILPYASFRAGTARCPRCGCDVPVLKFGDRPWRGECDECGVEFETDAAWNPMHWEKRYWWKVVR
jgi:hypothetical protein